jgi:hypothetical protein
MQVGMSYPPEPCQVGGRHTDTPIGSLRAGHQAWHPRQSAAVTIALLRYTRGGMVACS